MCSTCSTKAYHGKRVRRILYPQMCLGRQQSAQGVRLTKKVVLSASDVAVPDLIIVSSDSKK